MNAQVYLKRSKLPLRTTDRLDLVLLQKAKEGVRVCDVHVFCGSSFFSLSLSILRLRFLLHLLVSSMLLIRLI
jgi:hypothetical protein